MDEDFPSILALVNFGSFSQDHHRHLSPSGVLEEGDTIDELYAQLEQNMAEADNSRLEAFEESMRHRKAEKDVIDTIRRRQRKEVEEVLGRGKEELDRMRQRLNEVKEELRMTVEQKSNLEIQIAESNQMVQDVMQNMLSEVDLLQKYKKERDELQVERDNALQIIAELRKKQEEGASNTVMPQFSYEFSSYEIEEATSNFDLSSVTGIGVYGIVYKGILRHTQVAIKMLHSHHSLQGPSEFQQQVNILSNLRHPNIVTLIGACPEARCLVYEYLPNGSLEDRLSCRDNTPPLSWKTRIRIATELCSVLIFLHSCPPHGIVHGDLKPANILLDANYGCKLGDFRICNVYSSSNRMTPSCTDSENIDPEFIAFIDPKILANTDSELLANIDPEFIATGELTPKSDVYSFGIILLRFLTGRSVGKEVIECALNEGNLNHLLDSTAGDWPFVQAEQLAHLAIRCCETDCNSRPDLASDVWRVLKPMRISLGGSGGSSSHRMNSEDQREIPEYFLCPILQEAMQDPHIAADGFTYEFEALRGWLDSGHDTSPMTNLRLPHCDLLPNHALRSAIQEWQQQ